MALGVAFEQRPVDLDETQRPGERPYDYVLRVAREKAAEAARRGRANGNDCGAGELVLAADTTVVLDGETLGKPADPAEARAMLARIAGREHTVLTGIALEEPGRDRRASMVVSTRVKMAELSPERIAWYVGTGEPLDKAGSYGIQGLGTLLVEEVAGNYPNVVGLPVPAVGRLFAELGYDLLDFRRDGGGGPEGGAARDEPAERGAGDGANPGGAPLPRTALSQGPTASFPELAARYLGEYEEKIRFAVARLTEDELWWRPHKGANSVGNLLLHLAGNLSQWVVGGVGGEVGSAAAPPPARDRAGEFAADRSAGRGELLARLGEAVAAARAVLAGLTEADLARPLAIQTYDATVLAAAFHAVEHMSYHTGQILAVAKQLAGEREPFELYPRHRGE